MATPSSPGVYVSVADNTDYTPAAGQMTLCVIGGASKGPLNTPTLFFDEASLVRAFGAPLLNDYGLQAAVQFLKGGGRLLYCRVAHSAISADVPIPGLSGGTPAVAPTGSISFAGSANPTDGDTVTLHDIVPTLNLNANAVGAAQNVAITAACSVAGISGMSGGTVSARATGSINFIGSVKPADGDTITIGDGTLSETFQFKTSGAATGSDIKVQIGSDAYATMASLVTAINGSGLALAAVAVHQTQIYEFDNTGSWGVGHIPVAIGVSAAASLLNLLAAINLNATPALGLTAVNATVTVPALGLTQAAGGLKYNAAILESAVAITVAGMSGGVNAIAGSVTNVLDVVALNPGSWGNALQVVIRPTTTLGGGAGNIDLLVYAPVDLSGTLQNVETFRNVSTDADDARYVQSVVANGISGEVNPSNYVIVDVLQDEGSVTSGTYTLGTAGGATGVDGVTGLTSTDYIGSVSGQTATGLKAVRNPDRIRYNTICVPGVTHKDVITELLSLATVRNNCQVILDPPFGASPQQVVDWHNGVSSVFVNAPLAPLDSRFLTLYWSWVKITDQYNSVDLFVPPCGPAAAAWATTDDSVGSQFAPAGSVNGSINGNAVEYSPDQDERALLEGDQNRVNPIINAAVGGLMLYGNKTCQRASTYLMSLNIQRMLLTAQQVIKDVSEQMVFQPNDPVSWKKLQTLVNPVLDGLKANRGLVQFKIICDATVNTPDVVARRQMICRILMQPVLTAEVVSIDFDLLSNSTQFA